MTSKEQQQDHQEIYLQELQDYIDPRYGEITLFYNPETEVYFTRKQIELPSIELAARVIELINYRVRNPGLYYVTPLSYESDYNEKSGTTNIGLYMPFPHEDLAKEISERARKNLKFSDSEITFLMYDVMNGLYHIQKLGLYHGRVNPLFVAKTVNGYAIIDDPFYDILGNIDLEDRKKIGLYLSPEAFKALVNHRKLEESVDLIKADVFSLGLLLLEASILEDVNKIYGHDSDINYRLFDQLIHKMKLRYPENQLLTSTIIKMLEINQEKRLDFEEMLEKLPDYQLVKEYFNQYENMSETDKQSMRNSIAGKNENLPKKGNEPLIKTESVDREVKNIQNGPSNYLAYAHSPEFGQKGIIYKTEEDNREEEIDEDSPETEFPYDSTYAKICLPEERDEQKQPEVANFKPKYEQPKKRDKRMSNREIIEKKFNKWKEYQETTKVANRRVMREIPIKREQSKESSLDGIYDTVDTPTRTKQLMMGINQNKIQKENEKNTKFEPAKINPSTNNFSSNIQYQRTNLNKNNHENQEVLRETNYSSNKNESNYSSLPIKQTSNINMERNTINYKKSPEQPPRERSLTPTNVTRRELTPSPAAKNVEDVVNSFRKSRQRLPKQRVLERSEYILPQV